MTLNVENIHSVVHHKDPLCTVSNYKRNFRNAAKGGLKWTTHWAAYYSTNPKSWYAVPERARILSAIRAIQPLPSVPMAPRSVQKTRDWVQHLVLPCVSILSDRRQRWQELELLIVPLSERNSARSASNALTSRSSKKKTKRKMGC